MTSTTDSKNPHVAAFRRHLQARASGDLVLDKSACGHFATSSFSVVEAITARG
jgi:hypothetical protein